MPAIRKNASIRTRRRDALRRAVGRGPPHVGHTFGTLYRPLRVLMEGPYTLLRLARVALLV